jgi:hypothetical protein
MLGLAPLGEMRLWFVPVPPRLLPPVTGEVVPVPSVVPIEVPGKALLEFAGELREGLDDEPEVTGVTPVGAIPVLFGFEELAGDWGAAREGRGLAGGLR